MKTWTVWMLLAAPGGGINARLFKVSADSAQHAEWEAHADCLFYGIDTRGLLDRRAFPN